MAKELHRDGFHLVYAVPNQQWWITMGKGPVNTWSIISKHNTRAAALDMWKHMHRDCGAKCSLCNDAKLSPRDLKPGLRIEQIAHPEYGVWVVLRKYDKGIWEIRRSGRGDEMTLMEDEAHFWQKA